MSDEVETVEEVLEEESNEVEESEPEEEAGETTEESEAADTEDSKPARKGRLQKRINQITRDKYALQERLARVEGQLQSQQQQQPVQTPPAETPKPKMSDFDDSEEYAEKLAAWNADKIATQKIEAYKAEQERKQQAQYQRNVEMTWQQKQSEVREKYDDYDEVVMSAESVPLTPIMEGLLRENPVGPEIAYYLAKNPMEANSISMIGNPYQVASAFGKIEARIESGTKKVTPSKAPPPTSKPKGAGSGSSDAPSEKDSADVWRQKREAEIRKKRGY